MTWRRPSLLFWMALALLAAALSPVVIGALQLRSHRDALLDQVQRMQILAASTAGAGIKARVESLEATGDRVIGGALMGDVDSPAAQEVLISLLQADDQLVAAVLRDASGEETLKAQRREFADEITAALAAAGDEQVAIVAGTDRRWLRVRRELDEEGHEIVLVTDLVELQERFTDTGLVGDAQAALLDADGDLLLGDAQTVAELPAELMALARSRRLTGGAGRYRAPDGSDVVAANYPVAGTSWVVLSRQPRAAADEARSRMRQATTVASAGALVVALLLSWLGYRLLIQPMRRLARAQAHMVGVDLSDGKGSELDQLESTFAQLLQIEHDRESIGEVFLGRYQVISKLGKGGSGTVFRGYDPLLKRDVALKTIQLPANSADADVLVGRLQVEAVHTARINHPNIVTVHDFERRGDAAYIAMERVDGVSLADYMRAKRPLEINETMAIGHGVARALMAAHEEQLVHGDLKPSNVMLGRDGAIKVADFGTSQIVRQRQAADSAIIGTPGYIAPEVLEGKGSSQAADLFSFGVVLYEALAGSNPFGGGGIGEIMARTREANPTPIGEMREGLPPELERLVTSLMQKETGRRPGPASTIADLLSAMVASARYEWEPDPEIMAQRPDDEGDSSTDFLTRYLEDHSR